MNNMNFTLLQAKLRKLVDIKKLSVKNNDLANVMIDNRNLAELDLSFNPLRTISMN